MNILILGLKDEDGAGIVTNNINQYFLQEGHNSVLVVNKSALKNDNVIIMQKVPAAGTFNFFIEEIKRKFKRLNNRISPLERDVSYSFHNLHERKVPFTAKDILKRVFFKPDVILFFWVTGFINSETMKKFSEISDARLFWVGTDNAPFTGGCHYPWSCEGFHSDCSKCPAILTPSKKGIAKKNLFFKKKYLPDSLELIVGSTSDFIRASKSSVFKGKTIHKLVAPIDEKHFKPGDKAAAKSYFKIDSRKKTIFYGAYVLSDKRKGGKLFLEALHILKRDLEENDQGIKPSDFLLLVACKDRINSFDNAGIPVIQTGYLNDNDLIKAYQAADLFVCSSVEDSGPLMVNQSIMCGTPVVSFDTGVSMDLVHSGITGYRARLFDANDLAKGMGYILSLSGEEQEKMSSNCRTTALNRFSAKVYIDSLIKIFKGENIL